MTDADRQLKQLVFWAAITGVNVGGFVGEMLYERSFSSLALYAIGAVLAGRWTNEEWDKARHAASGRAI